jgi:hypothetical protein
MSQYPNQDQPYTDDSSNLQNPYDSAEQNPYDQSPSATPSQQHPYDSPSSYSSPPPPTGQPGYSYGSAVSPPPYQPNYQAPQPSSLPLGEAIRQLPQQYVRVLTKPSAATFAEEMGKAGWGIIWVQLIVFSVISAILSFLRSFTNPTVFGPATGTNAADLPAMQAFDRIFSLSFIITTIIFFFIAVGISYLIAKAFGGQGTFKAQSYTQLLFQVPTGILSGVLLLVPFVGFIGSFFLFVYSIVLQIFSIMAVHRLSGGKASAVVLIPLAVVVVLLFIAFTIFITHS